MQIASPSHSLNKYRESLKAPASETQTDGRPYHNQSIELRKWHHD